MKTAPRRCACPSGNHKARRIEHRVAGGDMNPYLMLAGVLGAALIGIEDGLTPPPPITGNAYDDWTCRNCPRHGRRRSTLRGERPIG
jgi:glutamine synthetase